MKRNKGSSEVKQDGTGQRERTGTRDIVETAIDLSKGAKTDSWDKMVRTVRVKRWNSAKPKPN